MKKIYISPVCEAFLTDEEERLLLSSAEIISADPGGLLPPIDPTIPIGDDVDDPNNFAKGGMVWDNTSIFD